MTDSRGRWFRVYARQVEHHPKFRCLTGVELGAWMALRSACELRDSFLLADRAEALLILRRRRIARPAHILDRLIEARLFDLDDDGSVLVHDRQDHDRPKYPSDEPEETAERKRRSRAVTSRDNDSHDTHARDSQQQAASSKQPQPAEPAPREGLPAENDLATLACRLLANGGEWLGKPEYVAAWDDIEHRYGDWAREELQPAYQTLLEKKRWRPWDLKHEVERRCAERARREDLDRAERIRIKEIEETERIRAEQAEMSDEKREQQALFRKAMQLWRKHGAQGAVPTDPAKLPEFIARYERRPA